MRPGSDLTGRCLLKGKAMSILSTREKAILRQNWRSTYYRVAFRADGVYCQSVKGAAWIKLCSLNEAEAAAQCLLTGGALDRYAPWLKRLHIRRL